MPATIRDILPPFLDYLKFEKRYSAHTIRNYSTDLYQLDDYLQQQLGDLAAVNLTPVILRSWLAGLKENGLEARSINRKISAARSFFRFHQRNGLMESNPAVSLKIMKTGKRLPSFLKEDQTEELMATEVDDSWKSMTGKLLLEILYNSGMRVSEVVSLKEKHIDTRRSAVKVLGKGNKERIIPLKPEMLKQIISYRDSKKKEFEDFDTEYLLVNSKGKKLNTQYAYRSVRELVGQLATTSRKHPHLMRHTFATQMANNGADLNAIKELLGHSSLAATQVYTHNTIEKLKEIHRKAHPKA
jgi:integrase/recombinase XerC